MPYNQTMIKLPHGFRSLEDQEIINKLITDEFFKKVMEEDMGKIRRIYADWDAGYLKYELLSGLVKQSKITELVAKMKEINYMKDFAH